MTRYRPTFAEIRLDRIAQNLKALSRRVEPGQIICPMLKANAYGHGAREIAARLRRESVTHIGVALIEEAVQLRAGGDRGPLLHFGLFDQVGAEAVLMNDVTPVISSVDALELWIDVVRKRASGPRAVHIKVNTGMNRLGLSPRDVPRVANLVARSADVVAVEAMMTHFSDADDPTRVSEQLLRFDRSVSEMKAAGVAGFKLHVSSSAAIQTLSFAGKGITNLGVRPGIALYGVEPVVGFAAPPLGVTPVMHLKSQIVLIQDVRRGERVSYGGRWTASRDSRIGVIPIGYADGYRRSLGAPVSPSLSLIRLDKTGTRVPLVGTVCMDSIMCDLTDVQSALVGDSVELLGDNVRVEEWEKILGTLSYEIFTGISERVPRLYVDGP